MTTTYTDDASGLRRRVMSAASRAAISAAADYAYAVGVAHAEGRIDAPDATARLTLANTSTRGLIGPTEEQGAMIEVYRAFYQGRRASA
jgi:hypothetical protein